jgi:hypothetical protein
MKSIFAGDAFKVLQQWSFPFNLFFEAVGECGCNGGVNGDRFIDDSGWTCQFGQLEALSCVCHRDRDNAGDQE